MKSLILFSLFLSGNIFARTQVVGGRFAISQNLTVNNIGNNELTITAKKSIVTSTSIDPNTVTLYVGKDQDYRSKYIIEKYENDEFNPEKIIFTDTTVEIIDSLKGYDVTIPATITKDNQGNVTLIKALYKNDTGLGNLILKGLTEFGKEKYIKTIKEDLSVNLDSTTNYKEALGLDCTLSSTSSTCTFEVAKFYFSNTSM